MSAKSAAVADVDYELRTHDNELVAIKHRTEFADGSKTFWYKRPDGKVGLNGQSKLPMPLYRSEKIADDWVVIAEGEKAADALAAAGLPALGSGGASSTPAIESLDFLRDKTEVYLWPDNDDVGRKHMRNVAERLRTLGVANIRIVNVNDLPEKADAADVHPDMYTSYLDGSEQYALPAFESNAPHIINTSDLKRMFIEKSEAKWDAAKSGHRLNLTWGFDKLDDITDGIQPGLIAIHGMPATGKTAWASQVAAQVDAPVLYLTAEMSVHALLKRMVSRVTKTPARELLSATLSPDEEEALVDRTLREQPKVRFVEATSHPVGIKYLRDTMQELKTQDAGGHAMLIIDSLHTWVNQFFSENPDMKEFEAINNGIVQLNDIATDLQIPILLVCERNGAQFKEGTLNAIAYGRVVAYRSSVVFSLDKAEEQSDEYGFTKDVTLSVLKNREGMGDMKVPFAFTGSIMKFEER